MFSWKCKNKKVFDGAIISNSDKPNKMILAFYSLGIETQPNWNLNCESKKWTKTTNEFFHLLHDTLLDVKNKINITIKYNDGENSNDTISGVLEGFFLSDTYSNIVDGNRNYNLFFHLKLAKHYKSTKVFPKEILSVNCILTGFSLPLDSFSYQYCNKFSAKNIACSFIKYLENVGNSKKGVGSDSCKVFQLEKGNPHQYCSLLLGT